MNSPQDPRKDPLQDDEVDLARVLRVLPGGEPSPQVDAAILAATMFLCLGMTGALAAVSGTWWPAGGGRSGDAE